MHPHADMCMCVCACAARQLSQRAFCDALHELGMRWKDLEGAEMDHLFKALDGDGSGLVEMHELEAAIGFIIDPSSDSALERLVMMDNDFLAASIQRLRGLLEKQASRTIDLFQRWDTDGNGRITKEEFRIAVTTDLGFGALTTGEVDCLVRRKPRHSALCDAPPTASLIETSCLHMTSHRITWHSHALAPPPLHRLPPLMPTLPVRSPSAR